jgi:hypothetical protein
VEGNTYQVPCGLLANRDEVHTSLHERKCSFLECVDVKVVVSYASYRFLSRLKSSWIEPWSSAGLRKKLDSDEGGVQHLEAFRKTSSVLLSHPLPFLDPETW